MKSYSFMKSCSSWILPALLGMSISGGCAERRGSGTGGTDGGRSDASSSVVAPPGDLVLGVESAVWDSPSSTAGRDALVVGVRLANGAGGDAASLNPALFNVRTDTGAEVLGGSRGGASDCSPDLAVAEGADRACSVYFAVPSGESPEAVTYRAPDGREATAAIVACAPGTAGLCPPGQVCVAGACQPLCSAEAPDGVCPSPDELCEGGACAARCSPEHPSGACDEGGCVDGVCNPSCTSFDATHGDCLSCANAVYERGDCGTSSSPPCADPEACAQCPLFAEFSDRPTNTCTCEMSSWCEGCEAEARAGYECLATMCPSCVR